MKNIFKSGITSNILKLVALFTMLLDHIGYYLAPYIGGELTVVLRGIGRISMPIYTYLIVQGFFYTSNFKKYIIRLGIFAVITQVLLSAVAFMDFKYVENYYVGSAGIINVLFTYVLSLGIIKLLHEDIIIKKWDYTKNMSLKVVVIAFLSIIAILLPFDYNIEVPLLTVLFYVVEKTKVKFMINTDGFRHQLGKFTKINERTVIQTVYVFILFIMLWLVTYAMDNNMMTLLSIIPIAMYNGERGNKSKILKNVYYIFFPIHHTLLYSLALILALT